MVRSVQPSITFTFKVVLDANEVSASLYLVESKTCTLRAVALDRSWILLSFIVKIESLSWC